MAKLMSTAAAVAAVVVLAASAGVLAQQSGQQALVDRVAASPGDIAARLELARVYLAENRLEDAERLLTEALALVRAQRQAAGIADQGSPIRVGGDIQAPALLKHVAPVYPELALKAKIQGFVIVEAVINEEGRVAGVKVLRSHPMFDQAALDAVRQWRYAPTMLGGRPVSVLLTATLNFNLR